MIIIIFYVTFLLVLALLLLSSFWRYHIEYFIFKIISIWMLLLYFKVPSIYRGARSIYNGNF